MDTPQPPFSAHETSAAAPEQAGRGDEGSVLDLLILLAKHKRVVLGLPLAVAVVALVVSLLLPKVYTARARIMPPQQNESSASAILGALNGGMGLGAGPIGSILNLKNPSELYVGMLKSESVADALIERFHLQALYDEDTLIQTRKALDRVTDITAGKNDGIITIEVEDKDPKRAAEMANAYCEELEKLTDRLSVTEAGQRRLFYEKQVHQAKEALTAAEIELKKTQEKTGLIKLDDQGRAIVEFLAAFKANVAVKEVELGAMRTFATEHNPDFIRLEQELAGMREQLRKMEKDKVAGEGEILIPTSRVPEAGLDYLRKFRDVKYYQTMFDLIAKQYELARLDEARDILVVQVLDRARPPDRKSKPKRALIVIAATLLTGIFAVFWVLLREAAERAVRDPGQANKLAILRRSLAWRRRR